MIICPHCDFSNREGTFLCSQCGTPLADSSVSTLSTRAVVGPEFAPFDPNDSVTVGWSQRSRAALYLKETKTMFPLEVGRMSYVLGRTSETELAPEETGIDLTPYFAQLKGVSRIHAVMRRTPTALTIV